MKLIIASLFTLFVLLSYSCSDKSNPINTMEYGKVLLKIDRANAPSSVSLIRATLSRQGFINITSTLNILSDSTADLLMDNIPVGNWHLKVDAMNDSMVVLYTGETDVNILAGFVTNINLNLIPTGQGTGSIYIYVTWGGTNINYQWIDNPTNPVLQSSGNYFDNYGVAQPVIMYDENKYKMWYHGDGGNAKKYVLYAESSDGKNWVKHPVPVLSPGAAGSWDSWAVQPGIVIKESGVYKMYFTGYANQNYQWFIGLATSTDGINWIKDPQNPFFRKEQTTNGWGNANIAYPNVVRVNNDFRIYYSGAANSYNPYYKIGFLKRTN
mgnify:CR=1 FL=1